MSVIPAPATTTTAADDGQQDDVSRYYHVDALLKKLNKIKSDVNEELRNEFDCEYIDGVPPDTFVANGDIRFCDFVLNDKASVADYRFQKDSRSTTIHSLCIQQPRVIPSSETQTTLYNKQWKNMVQAIVEAVHLFAGGNTMNDAPSSGKRHLLCYVSTSMSFSLSLTIALAMHVDVCFKVTD
jgi:hypothetical protein